MFDDAVAYVARESRPAAEHLLTHALDAASSLDVSSERGRMVPELGAPTVRELFVQRYRLRAQPARGLPRHVPLARPFPGVVGLPAVIQVVSEMVEAAVLGGIPPNEALAKASARVEAELKRAQRA